MDRSYGVKMVKEGSKWTSINETFVVIHTIELDGQTWIHYRKESNETGYNCYLESFLERFTPLA